MKTVSIKAKSSPWNPIEDIEEVCEQFEWSCMRLNTNEIAIQHDWEWGQFQFYWGWVEESQSLCVIVCTDISLDKVDPDKVYKLLSLINDRLWIGHFDLSIDDQPTFRHTLLLRGICESNSLMIEEMIKTSHSEFQRFYPVFEMVIEEGKSIEEAMSLAIIETMGEA